MATQPISDSVRFPFAVDARAGGLAREPDYARHVEQLIRQVLLTGPGERINRPDFGCGLRRMVFAPGAAATGPLLRVLVLQGLERWLAGVITVDDVDVDVAAVDETLTVRVSYLLNASGERRFLNVAVTP